MSKRRLYLLIFSAMVVLTFALVSTNMSGGSAFAMQQSGTSPGTGTYQPGTPVSPNDPNSGQTVTPGTQPYAQPNAEAGQSPNYPNRAGTQWGRVILSFIVGLIVGGLLFSGRRGTIGRDTRRAA